MYINYSVVLGWSFGSVLFVALSHCDALIFVNISFQYIYRLDWTEGCDFVTVA